MAVLIVKVRSIGDQAARGGEEALGIDGRQALLDCYRRNAVAEFDRGSTWRHDQPAVRLTRESRNGGFNDRNVACVNRAEFDGAA